MSNPKNPKPIALSFLAIIFVFVIVALIQNPPQAAEEHNHEEEQQQQPQTSGRMSGTLTKIDVANAKVIQLKPKELSSSDCANQIASALNKLNAIGDLHVDLDRKIVSVQYDSTKIDDKAILAAFASADHESVPVSEGS